MVKTDQRAAPCGVSKSGRQAEDIHGYKEDEIAGQVNLCAPLWPPTIAPCAARVRRQRAASEETFFCIVPSSPVRYSPGSTIRSEGLIPSRVLGADFGRRQRAMASAHVHVKENVETSASGDQ